MEQYDHDVSVKAIFLVFQQHSGFGWDSSMEKAPI